MYSNRVSIFGSGGTNAGSNVGATKEPGEPLHAGKIGGKSVWYKWRPPFTGITTITTKGSGFDTLLGIYEPKDDDGPSTVSNLVTVAGDDDRGGFFTSEVVFNVNEDNEYEIAVDGFSGSSGTLRLQLVGYVNSASAARDLDESGESNGVARNDGQF